MEKQNFELIHTSEYGIVNRNNNIYEMIGRDWGNYYLARSIPEHIIGIESRIKIFQIKSQTDYIDIDNLFFFIRTQQMNSATNLIYPNSWGLKLLSFFNHPVWKSPTWELLQQSKKAMLGIDEKSNLHRIRHDKHCVPLLRILEEDKNIPDSSIVYGDIWLPINNKVHHNFLDDCFFFLIESKEKIFLSAK